MKKLASNRFWRWSGVVVLTFVLIIATVFTYTAHNSTAYAGAQVNSSKHGTIPSKSAHITLGGTVDWSTLPKVAPNAAVPVSSAIHLPTHSTPMQRQAYYQSLKQHHIVLPKVKGMPAPTAPASAAQIAENAANLTNPNFDFCGYTILPCPVHSWAGLNSKQTNDPANPPDQAIASNPTYVMQGTDSAFAVYNFNGSLVYGPTSSYSFFASVLHSSNDTLEDPQMVWDATRLHWIIMEEEFGPDSSGNFVSYLDIGISKTQNATVSAPAQWYLYQVNLTAIIGTTLGTPGAFCDSLQVGGDYWGLWVGCTGYRQFYNSFTGNVVFGFSKNALYAGTNSTAFLWENIPDGLNGYAMNVTPAQEDGTPDAEFLIATDMNPQGSGPNNDLTTVAITDTHGLATSPQTSPHLTYVINKLPLAYTSPGAVNQPMGYYLPAEVGVNQVQYNGGNLYFAMTTATSNNNDGVYWVEVQPQLTPLDPVNPQDQAVANTIVRQNNIFDYANSGIDAFDPTLIGSTEDDETLVFNYSGTSSDPGIVYTGRRATDALGVMGEGSVSTAIVNGINERGYYQGNTRNWGLYFGCSLDTNLTSRGLVWCTGEYGGPNTSTSATPGWDTWVFALEVE